jgi:hypothetical protein
MKKIVVGAMLLALLGSPAVAQTSSTQPLPPGFANVPEPKWGDSDLPPGLSNANERSKRDWETPPGWSNAQKSQGWQDDGGPSATGGGPSSMGGGPSAMGAGKGRGR